MDINLKSLQKKFGKKAKEYANDKTKTKKLIDEAVIKAEEMDSSGPLDTFYKQLKLLFGLIKDWTNGSYRTIPKSSIVLIIIGILYFISPIDLIPDFIPGGFLDDAFVLGLIIKQVNSELEKYKYWKYTTSQQSLED